MDELSSFNRERWNGLVRAGILYSRPKLELDESSAREMVDEAGLLGDVRGKRLLVLAGGGGQQSAALGLLGAQITVLDLSDEQLANDKRAADHYGLSPVLLQGDMRDLSRFAEDAFDIVYQPFSINFVPDVRPVFAGVARVLKAGGLYHVQWHNPYTQTFNPDDYDPIEAIRPTRSTPTVRSTLSPYMEAIAGASRTKMASRAKCRGRASFGTR